VAPTGTIIDTFNINTSYSDQLQPDLAFNNQNYLVVWEDRRVVPSQIFYTIVTTNGMVQNDTGIKLSGNDSSDYYWSPATASNGDRYLIAWLGTRLSGDVILASRIDSGGTILDAMPISLTDDTLLRNRVNAASDGENFLVCWTGETPDTVGMDLYFRRISADGTILDSLPILVARNHWGIYEQSITYGGGCYFIVWNRDEDIYGCRILPDGTVLDSGGFVICADQGQQLDPAVASDGHRFLVTWTDGRSGNYDIYATFVDSAGSVGLEENNSATIINPMPVDILPVPFTNKINIKFNLPGQNNIELNIYDVFGRLVKSFTNPQSPSHNNNIIWDGTDSKDFALPNGTYFCRLRADSISVTKRIVKIKK
jgi:hypothetical protein